MSIFFTADQHFDHANIIGYQNRPFKNADEMNETIITNFNSVVKPNDTVWHLGDFVFAKSQGRAMSFWHRLNGIHHFMVGNHDKWLKQFKTEEDKIWLDSAVKIEPPFVEISVQSQQVIMCHYPLARWRVSYYGSWMLHGHCHGSYKPQYGRILDVGVDNNNFYPWSFWQIKDFMDKRPLYNEDKIDDRKED